MHKIMGGEFAIDNSLLKEVDIEKSNINLSSGRHALYSILNSEQFFGGKTILIPDYLCDSITKTISEAGWKYEFYSINDRLQFDIEKIVLYENIDAVLVINYFGMFMLNNEIRKMRELRPDLIIIEDDVQAFYEYKKSIADYSFTSLRKWFPCPDGAFIHTNCKHTLNIIDTIGSKWSQYKFVGNMLKNYGSKIDDSICLELLQKGEDLLAIEYKSACSETSKIIFSHINIDLMADKRKKNAKFLHDELIKLKVNHLYRENTVPFFIPIFIENRNALRRLFFQNNIFTPVHWPKVSDDLNGINDLYYRELSLICDQRYELDDMERQINIIRQFLDSEEM